MAEQILRRHPIRGFLYGILFGLGLVLVVVGQGWAALGTLAPFVVFLVGLVAATSWGLFGPSKAPKGPPPPEPVAVESRSAPVVDVDADADGGDDIDDGAAGADHTGANAGGSGDGSSDSGDGGGGDGGGD